MKRIPGLLLVCFVLAFCVAAPVVFGQDKSAQNPQEPLKKLKGYFTVKPLSPDVDMDRVMKSVNSGAGLQMWSYNITSSRDHKNYSGVMVGKSPFSTTSASSSITAQIVPLIIKITGPGSGGTATFDPTVADTQCLSAPNDVPLTLLQQSPLILNAPFTMNGVSVGTTQYTDAFQQANFWAEVTANNNNFHTLLSPVMTLAPITVTVPAANGQVFTPAQTGGCANLGLMDFNWFDSYVQNTLLPQLASQGVNPTTFPMFLMHNVVMYQGTTANCCILGYHGAENSVPVQTYSPFEFDTTGLFENLEDISDASHEVAEWMNDPLGNNPTPAWGHTGQVSGCQDNLEVGDPLSGTLFPPIKMPNGFSYHPQELAFFSWFYGAPSIGAGADFSDNGTFKTDAGDLCDGPHSFSISGQVTTDGAPLAGVTVTLSGAVSGTTTTGASGEYLFPHVPDRSNYTITPSLSGYTFSPPGQSITNLEGNVVADFTGDKLFPACAITSFAGPVNYATGSAPYSVSVGDFNGDGKPDLAVVNSADNNVSVLLGKGDGTFQAAVNYSVGNNPLSVAVGDFNGDGKLDLAVANSGDNNVSILLGKGDGTFQAAVNYSVGNSPDSVVVGDFNGDGNLDLAVTNVNGNNISILLGNGDGSFQTAITFQTDNSPDSDQSLTLPGAAGLTVADFNGDGKLDLALTKPASNNVSVLLGNGDGTFQSATNYGVGNTPTEVAAGDFNGDGKIDLAVSNDGSNNVSVLLGKGDGTFAAAVNYSAGQNPISVRVDDFNGDGKPDLIVANSGSNNISVLLGNGDGTFQMSVNFGAGSAPNALATGEFSVDEKPDVAVANFGGGNVSVLLNSCPDSDTISGQVTSGGTSLGGVTITLSGSSAATTTTNSSGNYLFPNLAAGGNYTVTPSLANYTFAPPSSTFNNLSANQKANFTALHQYTISGQVTRGGTALSGVTITLSGSSAATTATNSSGNYSFPNLVAGSNYTVTPSLANYTFAPPSSTFNNLSGNQTANFTATLNQYTLSGQVTSGGTALSGVTITLSGSSGATTTTNSSGDYSFPNLAAGGNYTVTPSLANYRFAPPSSTFNNLSANQTANFIALHQYTISGQVTSGGTALSGVTMALSGSSAATTTTNSSGNYSFPNLAAGNYTVTPSLTNYTFAPPSSTFNNLSANQTANFTATLNQYTIGGRVTSGRTGLSGVTITLSGSSMATTTTDVNGAYSFGTLAAGGSYTVTPSLANYTFAPPSSTFNNLSANQTANFTATLNQYTIGGQVTSGGMGLSGVTMTLSGSAAATTTTNSSGNYSFPNLAAGGTYTVTPTLANYTFTPTSSTFNNLNGNGTTNFTALKLYTISGQVTSGGTALSGVTMILSGSSGAITTTNSTGHYSFPNLAAGGNYDVTPSPGNYTFTPASSTFNNLSGNQTANFTATLNQYTISGQVTSGGTGLGGVTINLRGSSAATTTTNSSGAYSFPGLTAGGFYNVKPSLANYTFAPFSSTFNNLSANQTANFTAMLTQYTISGQVTSGGTALSGVTVTLSGSSAATTTTNSSGNYSFPNLAAGGNYTVTPSLANYRFAPASSTFNTLSGNGTINFTALNQYTISGQVTSGGKALSGVTITLSGSSAATTTTSSSGNYSFPNLAAGGNYTVTPSLANYTFAPPNSTFNNLSANQTSNFTATLNHYTISGQVTSGGKALSGVTIILSGSSAATTTTNASGNYSFPNLAAEGSYTVTPTLANYTFAPTSSTFNNLSGNQTANFTATLNHYAISGQVTSGGKALSGVTITLSGSSAATTTTNASGNYSFPSVAGGGNYTVTPSLTNYTFAPPSSIVNSLSGNQTANFTATLNHYAISGQVTSGGRALSGVTITLSGSSAATTTTNASGNYSFSSVAAGGNYTVTPTFANYTFAPPSSTFNNLSGNQTANFTATLNHYTISGQVTSGGTGLAGVTVTLSGSTAATTTTNSSGNYSFANLAAGGSYTVTPSLANYTFVPPSKSFSNLGSNQTQNFVGTFVPPLSVVQFSQASYPVTEGCVATTITALRTGDITKAASVDYETHDGSATEKTNYTYAAGTLEFAANQATQTFPVLLTENGYVQGPTTATIVLSNPVNATLGPINSASLTIADNDTTNNQPNPIDNPGIFACQNYHDFFSRQADQSGEAFWTGQTASCGSDESCLDDKRVNVSAAFFLSIEFQQTGYLVIRIQQESFATLPDYHVFLRETQQIGKGVVVGQAGYQQVLQQNTDAFATEWVARSDFQAKFGKLSNQQYVDTLYANAGVNGPSAEDRNTLISGLNAGTETKASVLLQVANSKEVYNTQYNPAFVLLQYFGYLRRNPQDAPDNNLNGFNFWLNKLNQFSQPGEDVRDSNVALLRVKRAEMVKAFIVSMEYRQRFGEFPTTP